MAQLSLFTFGYWGWGSETPLLLDVTAAVEEGRGFAPPCFVDIRASRSVRAAGFRDSAMEKLAGKERYVWMQKLGNKRVAERTDGKAEIIEPDAVEALLDLALECSRRKQRIIFFCACERPGTSKSPGCHRRIVADLLLRSAKRRHLDVGVGEWPGGEPSKLEVKVPNKDFKVFARDGASLKTSLKPAVTAGLPWGSLVTARNADEEYPFISGPGKPFRGKLVLPKLVWGFNNLQREWRKFEREQGLEWRVSGRLRNARDVGGKGTH
jgi:hypothetical protein